MEIFFVCVALGLALITTSSMFYSLVVNYIDGKNGLKMLIAAILGGISSISALFAFGFGLDSSTLHEALNAKQYIDPSKIPEVIQRAASVANVRNVSFTIAIIGLVGYVIVRELVKKDAVTYKAISSWDFKKIAN